jgi:large subunit ribosomal protein L21
MYAIVDIAGQQFKVEQGQEIFVNRLSEEAGASVKFDQVLLIDEDGKVKIGTPVVKGANVDAKVLDHVRGDKVKVFKKKRRKGYQKESGHRQDLSKVLIEKITF